jgi:hypothetical protein
MIPRLTLMGIAFELLLLLKDLKFNILFSRFTGQDRLAKAVSSGG